ncbi:MAG: 2-oxoacid:acceptor oxidoreductase subunit alpha [Planctomycetota bacterium]|nr:MAG: 2-oxoacid:acceptor oxidoreductase subunit alpha [Planctomycetota bacterium]
MSSSLTADRVVIRFAGDSGDGMQLTGSQFTNTSAIIGNDVSTFPDFPAEIRAPAGTLPGVSGFQIQFGSVDIHTPGDAPDVLVAMNPAALKVNLGDLPRGATIVVNEDAFTETNLKKAGYEQNPLEDDSLQGFRLIKLPITTLTRTALEEVDLDTGSKDRCKNFFALGLMYWLYERPLEPTLAWLEQKFAKKPVLVEANARALKAGHAYAETVELFQGHCRVAPASHLPAGEYRQVTGNEATALGLTTACKQLGLPLFYGSYPITPASDLLHFLSRYKNFDVKTFQAEDEIAAVCAAIGASYAGNVGITGTSGPGVALKSEAIGLAVMVELPLVVVNVQRAGPSTGMPTKTEQADLLQALWGRNGESPVAVLAPATPADCFPMAIEAVRLAVEHMAPVMLLSDGYLANGAEPWRIPAESELPELTVRFARADGSPFEGYRHDPETLARPWAVPGTPGLEHRVGGLEKWDVTGNISYDPQNHQRMCELRAAKIARMRVPDQEVEGDPEGELLVVSWGGTYGAVLSAVEQLRREDGRRVGLAHLRYLNPFPKNLGEVLGKFERVLVPELNLGQLDTLLRARFLVETIGYPKIQGRPFKVAELVAKMREVLA